MAIALHDAAHVRDGRWYDVFWVCNLAAWLIGPAAICRSALLATVAATWILPGTILWLLSAAFAGANLLPSSYGVHLGGSAIALWAVWRAGRARRSFWVALALPALAVALSRLFLPPEHNVNVAFAVPQGFALFARDFPEFVVQAGALTVLVCAVGQLVCEAVSRSAPLLAPRRR